MTGGQHQGDGGEAAHRQEIHNQDRRRGEAGEPGDKDREIAVGLVGRPSAQKDAAAAPRHIGGERGRGERKIESFHLVQHGDQPGRYAAARHGAEKIEQEEQAQRPVEQQLAHRHAARRCILAHLVVQDATLRDEGRYHRQTKTADHQQRRRANP